MKRFILFLLMGLFIFGVASCEEFPTTTNELVITLVEDTVVWDAYPDAVSYNIYVDNILHEEIVETKYDLVLKEGTYKIKINAKLSTSYSSFSNIVEYTSDGSKYPDDVITLDAPVIKLTEGILSWNKVNNAEEYHIFKNDEYLDVTTNLSYAITETPGDKYYVKAFAGISFSSSSNVIEIEEIQDLDYGTINIFSINDTHGAIETSSTTTGMAQVASVVNSLETSSDYIKVANGDIFQGGYASNITRGRIFIDVLNAMEFDCFVIGNHEFDWGIEKISVYNDGDLSNGEANFPFLGANIVYKSSSTMPDWLEEYTIVENNGLRVGIIGVIGEGLTSSINSEFVEDYTFLNPVPIVERLSKKLRTIEQCDSVIVAIHEYEDSTNNSLAKLVNESRIDGILCAHTHQKINETVTRTDGYKIPVLQSNTKNYNVGTMSLELQNGNITSTTVKHYVPSSYAEDIYIKEVISQYQDIIDEGEEIIGYTSSQMSKSKLGNLAANAMVNFTGRDFACLNTGGVRGTINAGDIQMKEVYEVFPFDNYLIEVSMTGSQLKSFYNAADGYLYFSSNINVNSLTSNKTYKIIVIDYVYNYYYYQKYFNGCPAIKLEQTIRDAVVYQIKEGN